MFGRLSSHLLPTVGDVHAMPDAIVHFFGLVHMPLKLRKCRFGHPAGHNLGVLLVLGVLLALTLLLVVVVNVLKVLPGPAWATLVKGVDTCRDICRDTLAATSLAATTTTATTSTTASADCMDDVGRNAGDLPAFAAANCDSGRTWLGTLVLGNLQGTWLGTLVLGNLQGPLVDCMNATQQSQRIRRRPLQARQARGGVRTGSCTQSASFRSHGRWTPTSPGSMARMPTSVGNTSPLLLAVAIGSFRSIKLCLSSLCLWYEWRRGHPWVLIGGDPIHGG